MKDQEAILKKLGITALNEMQEQSLTTITEKKEVVLLSPTGTGKTLAFLLPLIPLLDRSLTEVQMLIVVPSRELAIQIEQVLRDMGTGFKVNAVYGGRSGSKDRMELKQVPTVLMGTPGRIADHIRREAIYTDYIKYLVLDEFDKSLEVGFEKEMKEILFSLPALKKKVLTSATHKVEIPPFVGMKNPEELNYLSEKIERLQVKIVYTSVQDKAKTLLKLLSHIGEGSGIIFCSFKSSIQDLSEYLKENKIAHTCFYGGLEQIDRERALIKFRNGTYKLMIATDLAARGIDVPELDFIIHYEMPVHEAEFIHRNGRTARMHSEGVAYVIRREDRALPEYIVGAKVIEPEEKKGAPKSQWSTVFISGGRKDKISKGDIAGLFFKEGGLDKGELGLIELKQDCAFVAVPRGKVDEVCKKLNNTRLKKKKVRIEMI